MKICMFSLLFQINAGNMTEDVLIHCKNMMKKPCVLILLLI